MDALSLEAAGLILTAVGTVIAFAVFVRRLGAFEGRVEEQLRHAERSRAELKKRAEAMLCDVHTERLAEQGRRTMQTEQDIRDLYRKLEIFREEVLKRWRNGNENPDR